MFCKTHRFSKRKKRYWQNMSTVASEIARSNDVFIKHNFDNHDGEVPVWAAVEVLSFGTLSKIIKNLKTGTGSSYSILASNYQYRSKKGNLVKPSQKNACFMDTERFSIELYINDDKELFKGLYSHKDDVESAMGLALDWRELPEGKASRIIVEKDVKFDDQNAWPQQFEYIMDVCMKMKKAFRKYIQKL